jgi:hypothetical protein
MACRTSRGNSILRAGRNALRSEHDAVDGPLGTISRRSRIAEKIIPPADYGLARVGLWLRERDGGRAEQGVFHGLDGGWIQLNTDERRSRPKTPRAA